MSTFACKVVKVTVKEHPNADALDIVEIAGYNCVSQYDLKRLYRNFYPYIGFSYMFAVYELYKGIYNRRDKVEFLIYNK